MMPLKKCGGGVLCLQHEVEMVQVLLAIVQESGSSKRSVAV